MSYRENYDLIVWSPIKPTPPRVRPANVAPYVISDTMDLTQHMATGRHVDSKSEFRKMTRAAGCEEVGNEIQRPKAWEAPPKPGRDIQRAIAELKGR